MGIYNVNRVFYMDDIVKGEDAIFVATGVTEGVLLKGVQYKGSVGTTHTLVKRAKSGTVRFIEGKHRLKKKPALVIKL